MIKKKSFFITEKVKSVLYVQKYGFFFFFFYEENSFINKFMQHGLNRTNNQHNNTWSLSLFQKSACIKKIRSISKEDTNHFFY